MKVVNSYIFILKTEKLKKENSIVVGYSFPSTFEKFFAIDTDKVFIEKLQNSNRRFSKETLDKYNRVIRGIFQYKVCEEKIEVKYKITEADGTYYLDIIINNSKGKVIACLEKLNDVFTNDKAFCTYYTPIISYDYVSESYCNKVYPLLNQFERKFRKLLFIVFTAQFKKMYFEETATKTMVDDAKTKIRSKKEENRIQNYFYALDMGQMRSFLFDETWTSVEENQADRLLNRDLSKINPDKLKEIIRRLRPKSNWERFFADKNFPNNIKETMQAINDLRNLVAHSKIFSRNQYEQLFSLLNENMECIDNAIKITETVDFKLINRNKYYNAIFNNIGSALLNVRDYLIKTLPIVAQKEQKFVEAFLEAMKKTNVDGKKGDKDS